MKGEGQESQVKPLERNEHVPDLPLQWQCTQAERHLFLLLQMAFPNPKPRSRLAFLYPLPPPSLFGIFRTLWYKGGIVIMDVCRVQ